MSRTLVPRWFSDFHCRQSEIRSVVSTTGAEPVVNGGAHLSKCWVVRFRRICKLHLVLVICSLLVVTVMCSAVCDPYFLATVPHDASVRNGGEETGAVPRTGMPAAARRDTPCSMTQYLLKQEVINTVGVALRANMGSTVTQLLICNVLAVVEQLQAFTPMAFAMNPEVQSN